MAQKSQLAKVKSRFFFLEKHNITNLFVFKTIISMILEIFEDGLYASPLKGVRQCECQKCAQGSEMIQTSEIVNINL